MVFIASVGRNIFLANYSGDKYMEAGYMRVVGGTLNKDLMELKSFEASCITIKPHPGFNFKSRAFDVAVIEVWERR